VQNFVIGLGDFVRGFLCCTQQLGRKHPAEHFFQVTNIDLPGLLMFVCYFQRVVIWVFVASDLLRDNRCTRQQTIELDAENTYMTARAVRPLPSANGCIQLSFQKM